jgi:cell wall-associated NlpC family hydrolase
VIAYACAQVGDPYLWGGSGPDRFDCSGLTMMAWRQSGVFLPHNAAMQAHSGTTVGQAELRPGDLVFFFRPIGHNGIYIGNGLMIHAPQTGDSVKIDPVSFIGSFTTAIRL